MKATDSQPAPTSRRLVAAGRITADVATMTVALPMPERLAAAYDSHGSYWGSDSITATTTMIREARDRSERVEEWQVVDRAGRPLRIVRIADGLALDTIVAIPGRRTITPEPGPRLRLPADPRARRRIMTLRGI